MDGRPPRSPRAPALVVVCWCREAMLSCTSDASRRCIAARTCACPHPQEPANRRRATPSPHCLEQGSQMPYSEHCAARPSFTVTRSHSAVTRRPSQCSLLPLYARNTRTVACMRVPRLPFRRLRLLATKKKHVAMHMHTCTCAEAALACTCIRRAIEHRRPTRLEMSVICPAKHLPMLPTLPA